MSSDYLVSMKRNPDTDLAICEATTGNQWQRDMAQDGEYTSPCDNPPGYTGEIYETNHVGNLNTETGEWTPIADFYKDPDAVFAVTAREALPYWICQAEGMGGLLADIFTAYNNDAMDNLGILVSRIPGVLQGNLTDRRLFDALYVEKLELVAEAVREYKNYAWKPYNHRTFSQEALGSLEKRVCDSLAAMDGDGKREEE